MNRVLWPATWGYFLDRMLYSSLLSADAVSTSEFSEFREIRERGRHAAYELFRDYVRARGPLPALRIGNQPYGVLPLIDLDRWQPSSDAEAADGAIAEILRRMRDRHLGSGLSSIHQVGKGSKPERTLLSILS
jgi:hypothetical protein